MNNLSDILPDKLFMGGDSGTGGSGIDTGRSSDVDTGGGSGVGTGSATGGSNPGP